MKISQLSSKMQLFLVIFAIFGSTFAQNPLFGQDETLWDDFFNQGDAVVEDCLSDSFMVKTEIGRFTPTSSIILYNRAGTKSLSLDFSSDTLKVYGTLELDSAAVVFCEELIVQYNNLIYDLRYELEKCKEEKSK